MNKLFPCLLGMALALGAADTRAGTVLAIGQNTYGQRNVPAELTDAAMLEAGRDFSLALKSDGTLAGWGYNGNNRATPPANLNNVLALSAGVYHTLALKSDGTVTGWGFDGNNILAVPADLNNVLAVAAGGFHSLAVKRDGTVVGWGFTGNGRIRAPATLTDVIAIAAGRDHSVALKSDGTVVAWGLNDLGQATVPAGLNNVVAISAGDNHTLALKSDGTVVAWGSNRDNQIAVPATLSNVIAVSAGSQHSLALKADGTVAGWGNNANGQINVSGWTGISSIAAGGFHTLAIQGGALRITTQPRSQTVLAGASVTFTVAAAGAEPLSYQWQFNGAAISGATGPSLLIPEAGRDNAGVYTVRISNANGSTTSQNAALIVRGLQQLTLPELLANGTLRLTFGDLHGDPISSPNVFRYQVEASSDLETWTPLNLPLTLVDGRIRVEDPDAGNYPKRFYRVVEQ
ncbi:MAG: immunoglobulin domain-containing protein [Verrucomicrobiota bacterium]